MAQRRRRVDSDRRVALLAALAEFPVAEDAEPKGDPWGATSRLADLHRLTVHDVANLELAQRRRLPLATLDGPLRDAAGQAAVPLLP